MSNEEQSTTGPSVGIKLIKNSKGYTWEVKAYGWPTVEEAFQTAKAANAKLQAEYGHEGQAL